MCPTNPDGLPTSREQVLGLSPQFDRLEPDSPVGSPYNEVKILKYLRAGGAEGDLDLVFGRTAKIGQIRFWLWGYVDKGRTYFVDVSTDGKQALVSMGLGDGLTPEQYLALRYARQWSGKPRKVFD